MKDFKECRLRSWDELHKFAKFGWAFRGQRKANWPLETSFDRRCKREGITPKERGSFEQRLVREFRRAYHHYDSHVPEPDHSVEWLSLMQHHGAPTRLLDFSYSIYVATHFAIESADGDCAIWALRVDWLLKELKSLAGKAGLQDDAAKFAASDFAEDREAVVKRLFFNGPCLTSVAIVNPFHLNQRLRTQRGVFVMQGCVKKTFMKNLEALSGVGDPKNLVRIVIPASIRKRILEGLYHMNISRASLFPGLDGFAESLGSNVRLLRPTP